jgi:hypothetical protein
VAYLGEGRAREVFFFGRVKARNVFFLTFPMACWLYGRPGGAVDFRAGVKSPARFCRAGSGSRGKASLEKLGGGRTVLWRRGFGGERVDAK